LRVKGSGFEVWDLRFRACGLGFRVKGLETLALEDVEVGVMELLGVRVHELRGVVREHANLAFGG